MPQRRPSSARRRPVVLGLALLLLCLIGPSASAIVYTLRGDTSPDALRRALGATVVLQEKITINGVDGDMDIAISDLDWGRLLDSLKPLLTDFAAQANADSVLLSGPDGRGGSVRHLIAQGDVGKRPTIFTMTLPQQRRRAENLQRYWPKTAPLPADADVELVVDMPGRNLTWGQFACRGRHDDLLRSYHARLVGDGWKSLSLDRAGSAALLSPDGAYMAVLAVAPTPDADTPTTRGSLFVRRVK